MTVLRIVTNIATDNVLDVRKFYSDLFGLDVVMDHGWLVTLASRETTIPQISIASEGGSGTPCPICRSRSTMWTRCIFAQRDRLRSGLRFDRRTVGRKTFLHCRPDRQAAQRALASSLENCLQCCTLATFQTFKRTTETRRGTTFR